jgi:hypothetical protein
MRSGKLGCHFYNRPVRTRILACVACLTAFSGLPSAQADLVVTTLSGNAPRRGISLTADAREFALHSSEGPVVKFPTGEVIEVHALPAPVAPPEATRPFEIELTDGSLLRGVPMGGDTGTLKLRSRILRATEGAIDIPIEQILRIRRVTGADLPAASRLVPVKDTDVAYRIDGGRVTGFVESFSPTGVRIDRGEGNTRSIPFEELAALFVDNDRPAASEGLQLVARLADGSAVRLDSEFRIAAGLLQGKTPAGLTVQVSMDHTVALGIRGGSFVQLSDLVPTAIERRPFFPLPEGPDAESLRDFICPVRMDRSPDNRPIHLSKRRYFKGIGVRPRTELRFALDGKYRRFEATCGIDDEVLGPGYGRGAGTGSVIFIVLLDGQEKHRSPVVRGGREPHSIGLDLSGAREITLVVDFVPASKLPGKTKDSPELDNAVWASPILIR